MWLPSSENNTFYLIWEFQPRLRIYVKIRNMFALCVVSTDQAVYGMLLSLLRQPTTMDGHEQRGMSMLQTYSNGNKRGENICIIRLRRLPTADTGCSAREMYKCTPLVVNGWPDVTTSLQGLHDAQRL